VVAVERQLSAYTDEDCDPSGRGESDRVTTRPCPACCSRRRARSGSTPRRAANGRRVGDSRSPTSSDAGGCTETLRNEPFSAGQDRSNRLRRRDASRRARRNDANPVRCLRADACPPRSGTVRPRRVQPHPPLRGRCSVVAMGRRLHTVIKPA